VDTGDEGRGDADSDSLLDMSDDASAADASVDGSIEASAKDTTAPAMQVCDGLCVQLNDKSAVCSHPCVFGETSECAPSSGGLRRGGCLFVTEHGTIGDLGYCGELCDCNDDCIEPTFVCDAFDNADLERAFGRKGACTSPELVLARQLVCSG
jgi:hypothetical protein